ncbi:MAG: serine/threonine-protein kinase, partial [Gemmatimonadota bacterium]
MSDICPSCGHPSDPDAERCAECGTPLGEDAGLDPLGRRLQARTEGRYRIVRRLGSGGMAAVYEAVDSLDRQWAIKVLSDVLLAQPEMVGRFEREARTISRLRHPHVVQLHNFEPHDDLHFLVLEFVPGSSLKDVLREGPLPIATGLEWFGQIADALDYAHRQGVIHRDIKPDNILIRPTGEAVITDFGIARDETGNTALTRPGTALGTGYYMSPEQWKGQRVDGAADQYSLGVVMWEAVAGRRPFRGETLTAVMLAHLSQDVPDLASVRGDVPAELAAAVARMLSKDPAKRFPSVLEAARAAGVDLSDVTSAVTTPGVSATEVPTVVPSSGRTETPGEGRIAEPAPEDVVEPARAATGGPSAPTEGGGSADPVPPTLVDHRTALTTRLQRAATAVGTALKGFGGPSLPRAARLAAGAAGLVVVSLVLYATLGPDGGGPDASGDSGTPAVEQGHGPAPGEGGAEG